MELTISPRVSKEAEHDIIELKQVIDKFQSGKIDNERFRAFHLTGGVMDSARTGFT